MQEKIFSICVAIFTISLCIFMPKIYSKIKPPPSFSQEFAIGIVKDILEENLTPDPVVKGKFRGIQKLNIQIIDGSQKNKEFEIYNTLSSLHNTRAYKGFKAVFTVRNQNGKISVWLYNQKRDTHIYILASIFLIALILLGKRQGLKSIIALSFIGVTIITVLIPAIFAGFSPIPISIFLVSIMTFVSFILISGFSRKTYSAIIGTMCGITIAGICSIIVSITANISGINMEAGEQLLNIAPDYNIKLSGILFSSILIASLGAVMDVSMSMASSMQEIFLANPKISSKDLFLSGLNVGRDITGTMSNTLILAFAGSSLPLIMMIWAYGMSIRQFMNIPRIVIEIMHGLSGSIGIIASVPCTAIVSIFLLKKNSTAWKKHF